MTATHLIINYFQIEEELILVGATDNERWRWDIEDGMSGVDAKTIVTATLIGNPHSGYALLEKAHFFCKPDDPVRPLAMKYLPKLFDIAWEIRAQTNTEDVNALLDKYFGFEVKS